MMCNNCIHKPVCGKFRATGGVKKCEHFKEERKGRWRWGKSTILEFGALATRSELYCGSCGKSVPYGWTNFSFCPHCGADMRKSENDTKCIKNEVSNADFAKNPQNGSPNSLFDDESNIDWGAKCE